MNRNALWGFLGVFVMASAVLASVEAGASFKYKRDKDPAATDIHFIVYQKEPNISIDSADVSIIPADSAHYKTTDDGKGDGKWHAVVIDAFGNYPKGTQVTIKVKFYLTNKNTVRIKDVKWTIVKGLLTAQVDTLPSGVPNHGFVVTDLDQMNNAQYFVCNDDTIPIEVSNLVYARNQPSWIDPADLFEWPGWEGTISPFTVPPEDSVPITFSDLILGTYLFTKYDLRVPGNTDPVGYETNIHQVDPLSTLHIKENISSDPDKLLEVVSFPHGLAEIRYQLSKATKVTLTIYSLTGEKAATLVDDVKPAGEHTVRWDATGIPTGVYFCRLTADGISVAEKMVRLK